MLTKFQSKASADVVMFGDVAQRMIQIIGKAPTDKGIVTVADLPEAIAKLQAAIDADTATRTALHAPSQPEYETAPDGRQRAFVSVAHRARPLLVLFERSVKRDVPVVWGV